MTLVSKVKGFFKDPLFKQVWKFSYPVMIDQFAFVLITSICTGMCGQVDKIATSAVGLCDSLNNFANQIALYIATAGGIIVAQRLGKGDKEKAKEAADQGVVFSTIVMIAFSLLIWLFRVPLLKFLFGRAEEAVLQGTIDYMTIGCLSYPFLFLTHQGAAILRAHGKTKVPMIANIATAAVLFLVGYPVIVGITINGTKIGGLGIVGAAISMVFARAFSTVFTFVAMKKCINDYSFSIKDGFKFAKDTVKPIYNIAIPAALEGLIFMGGRVAVQAFTTLLDTFSIAANNVATTINNLACVPAMAYVTATSTAVAKAVGEGDRKIVKKTADMVIIQGMITMAISTIIFSVFAGQIGWLYSNDADVIARSAQILHHYGIFASVMFAPAFDLPGAFRGAGDAKFAMIIANINMLVLRVGMAYYLTVHTPIGIDGIWYAMYADWVIRIIFYGYHYFSGKWLKKCGMYEPKVKKARA